jgi:hypothetical protein
VLASLFDLKADEIDHSDDGNAGHAQKLYLDAQAEADATGNPGFGSTEDVHLQ